MTDTHPSPQTPPSPLSSTPSDSAAAIAWAEPSRPLQFEAWLAPLRQQHQLVHTSLRLASADASFRRYFRIQDVHGRAFIIMDAPPDKENSAPFVQVAHLMRQAGLLVPDVLDWQQAHGFLLLTDLGTHTMMQSIDAQAAPPLPLYMQAVDALITWQLASQPGVLAPYDAALLRRELQLFPDWYVAQYRKKSLNDAQHKVLEGAFDRIVADNLLWPQVYVHRDFMPRNLMVSSPQRLGVLDFQDAVYGPITYDIASLMRDAFLSWDESFCLDVTIRYWDRARQAGLPVGDDFGVFYKGVEWMGLQRHLKVAGIFARLTLRDGKPQYLADTPRFIAYMHATCSRYIELKPLLRLIEWIEGIDAAQGFAYGRM